MLKYEKSLEVYATAEVVVVGGGPSGIAAAVSAAKLGRSTLLIERTGSLGGASASAMVAELMNFDDGVRFISGGFGREVYDRLGYSHEYKRSWHNVRIEKLKRIYDDMILESRVDLLLYTSLVDAVSEGGRVKYILVSTPSGPVAIVGRVFIDATGTGLLSALAGAEFSYGDGEGRTMSATVCSLWGGVDFERKPRDADFYEAAYADGVFSYYDNALPGIKRNFPEVGVGGGNVGHAFGVDDRDARSMTEATVSARRTMSEYERFYRGYVPGCERATLLRTADYIGIRESRRIRCEYELCADDFRRTEPFYDEIGRYSYPIDIHPMTADAEGMKNFYKSVSIKHEDGETYGIPYRALVVRGFDNLLVAGRSISADRSMQASARVIPCCYITGQAAGVGAAIAVASGCAARDVDVRELQSRLKNLGAYITV